MLLLATAGCSTPEPAELRLEGERALLECGRKRIDTSVCQGLELIQAEYRLCRTRNPEDAGCDEVWRDITRLTPPARLPPAPLFERDSLRAR